MYKENLESRSRKICFGRIIKSCRVMNGIPVEEVCEYLKENDVQNIKPSTVYAWEDGYSVPNSITFLALCNFYSINDILETFEWVSTRKYYPSYLISKDEYDFLTRYRSRPDMHDLIDKILE
ncbi:MAG: helix-turn-helix domain-containing protein [Lachnospiraceae bacterium]|nr:helix-turn-helix domain-containing protein [Lachnospiraceae bacterium]